MYKKNKQILNTSRFVLIFISVGLTLNNSLQVAGYESEPLPILRISSPSSLKDSASEGEGKEEGNDFPSSSSYMIRREKVLRKARQEFAQLDSDQDQRLTRQEWERSIEKRLKKLRAYLENRWQVLDPDKKEIISLEQFIASRAEWFDAVDADQDEKISYKELREYRQRRAQPAAEAEYKN